jgi:hypothetical protein
MSDQTDEQRPKFYARNYNKLTINGGNMLSADPSTRLLLTLAKETTKLAIVGSRDYHDYDAFSKHVATFLAEANLILNQIEIVSGGANGADALAERWAKEHNIKCIVFPADWAKYGNSAGPRRNQQIVDYCDRVLAFPSRAGRGTQDTIDRAHRANKPLTLHYID